jgi:hypothetical protein
MAMNNPMETLFWLATVTVALFPTVPEAGI